MSGFAALFCLFVLLCVRNIYVAGGGGGGGDVFTPSLSM
jgi:hypothetical protein